MSRRALLVLVCSVACLTVGCADPSPAGGTGVEAPPSASPGTTPTPTPTPTASDAASEGVPFQLLTHCGINELAFEGRFYERVGGPLTDGSGNPPAGWDNPSQPGALTVAGDRAVFTDDLGHREEFHVRPGATDFLQLCA